MLLYVTSERFCLFNVLYLDREHKALTLCCNLSFNVYQICHCISMVDVFSNCGWAGCAQLPFTPNPAWPAFHVELTKRAEQVEHTGIVQSCQVGQFVSSKSIMSSV